MNETGNDPPRGFDMTQEHIVGIISDTHDHRECIRLAVNRFNEAGCGLVIHAGDIVAPFTIREFEKLHARFVGVFGNNDGEKKGLMNLFGRIGTLHQPPHEFLYAGKRFAVMHAPDYLDSFKEKSGIDVIVYGHTHKIDIVMGPQLIVNPGECCAWLTGRSTIALLDLSTMDVETVDLL